MTAAALSASARDRGALPALGFCFDRGFPPALVTEFAELEAQPHRWPDAGYDHTMSTDELSFGQKGYPSCHSFAFTTFASRSMASAPVLTRAWRHPSGMPATGWCDGSRAPVHFTSCRASQAGAPASTMP